MRKMFLSAAALTIAGLMLHDAFACELNREASQPASAIVLPGACSGSDCLVNPPQDTLIPLANEKLTPVDPVLGAVAFLAGVWGRLGIIAGVAVLGCRLAAGLV